VQRELVVSLGTVCLLSLMGCANQKAATEASQQAAAQLPSGTLGEEVVVTATATVEKIDVEKRLVTLRGPQGRTVTVTVDERVKNLPQVRVGDEVIASYYESVAYQVRKPGEATPGAGVAAELETAKPGEKPAGIAARVATVTATITAIDAKTPSVTLMGPEGRSVTVKVRDPKKLESVKVGDLVEIRYREAFAISVEKAPKQ